jgi:hypothetical protein
MNPFLHQLMVEEQMRDYERTLRRAEQRRSAVPERAAVTSERPRRRWFVARTIAQLTANRARG